MQMQPLTPSTIIVAQQPILGVRPPDGSIGAVFSYLCTALALAPNKQVERIRRHPVLKTALVSMTINTAGGPQQVNVLQVWAIPLWLAGIRFSAVAPALRKRLVIFQREVADALYRHFFRPIEPVDQAPDEASGPASQQIAQTLESMDKRLSMLTEQMVVITETLTTIEMSQSAFARQSANTSPPVGTPAPDHQSLSQILGQTGSILDTRLDAIEGTLDSVSARLVDLLANLPIDALAPYGSILPARLAHVYVLARALRQKDHVPIAETLALLAEHFNVKDVSDLPVTAWPDILAWFRGRLAG